MTKSVAIVTGASSGIGKATALRLARDFEAVVIVARDGDRLAAVGKEIESAGAKPLAIEIDLTAGDAAEKTIGIVLNRFGRIDALLNIAGAVPAIDLFKMNDEQWLAGLSLKFHGARRLTTEAWTALRAAEGAVAFVSGNAAVTPKPGAAAVGVINAAIEALAKAFAERGIEDGVQVNCVSPGAILTGRRASMLETMAAARNVGLEEAKGQFLKQAAIARFGEAEEIADLMAFVVSPAARWLTGTVLRMDGGEIKSV